MQLVGSQSTEINEWQRNEGSKDENQTAPNPSRRAHSTEIVLTLRRKQAIFTLSSVVY
jgi:hypothetical protein